MMFFEGYIGAPPTVTVCSFICACVGVATTAARTSVATATAVGRVESFMSMLHVLFAASAACARRYAARGARMQCADIFRPRPTSCLAHAGGRRSRLVMRGQKRVEDARKRA